MKLAHKDKQPVRLNLKDLRDRTLCIVCSIVIALKNIMFAEEQSDVQEFFLYLIDELSKEIDSFSSGSLMDDEGEGWEEVGHQGKRLVIQEAVLQRSILTHLFETQLRSNVEYCHVAYIGPHIWKTSACGTTILHDLILTNQSKRSKQISGELNVGQLHRSCIGPLFVWQQ